MTMNPYELYEALKGALPGNLPRREYEAVLRLLAEVCGV